jgi:hypothetical protein
MGFPSKDGFWVTLDGIIEFRVMPERAAEVYVIYNELENDAQGVTRIDEEVIKKVVFPNARSFCRSAGLGPLGTRIHLGRYADRVSGRLSARDREELRIAGNRDRPGADHQDQSAPADRLSRSATGRLPSKRASSTANSSCSRIRKSSWRSKAR